MEFFYGIFDDGELTDLTFIEDEFNKVKEALSPLDKEGSDQLRLKLQQNVSIASLKEDLINYRDRITIFHFSGHHNKGVIQLNDQRIKDEGIIDLLNQCEKLKMVFLNGCCTENIVDELKNIPIVIGTKTQVTDYLAYEFSTTFYKSLATEIEHFRDAGEIERHFKDAQSFLLGFTQNGQSTERGGGNYNGIDIRSRVNNYIFKSNPKLPYFENRITFNLDLSKYAPTTRYKEKIKHWFNTENVAHEDKEDYEDYFYKYFPIVIANFLKEISPKSVNDKSPIGQLGDLRFKLLQKLYFSLLALIKKVGYSILWEFLLENDLVLENITLQKNIREQLKRNWYDGTNGDTEEMNNRVTFLKGLFLEKKNLGIRNNFLKECSNFLNKNETRLKEFGLLFCHESTRSPNQKELLAAEQFLYLFVDKCSFLKNYEMASIHGSIFYKYRIEGESYHYRIKYFHQLKDIIKKGQKGYEKTKKRIYDVYSIVLKDKRDKAGSTPLVNLSPFFIDNNIDSSDLKSNQIDLLCLRSYSFTVERLIYYNYTDFEKKIILDKEDEITSSWKNIKIYEHIEKLLEVI